MVACLVLIGCGGGRGSKGTDHPKPNGDGTADTEDGAGAGGEVAADVGAGNPADDDDDNGGGVAGNPADDDDDHGDGDDGAAPPAAPDARFATSVPADKMSSFLVSAAEGAMKKQNWPLAISLYRGLVIARGAGSPEAMELAKAWTLAGQYDDAKVVLEEFIGETTDGAAKKAALKERRRLETAKNPFANQSFQVISAESEANKAFKLGRAAFKKKQYADALLYFRMGSAMAPDLPGFLRELGATYDKLGAEAEKTIYYQKYLHDRPFGKNAEFVRKSLLKVKGATGKITIKSALPCDDFWMQAQNPGRKLPIKDLVVPPGTYKALCINYAYQIAYYELTKVEAGKSASMAFDWAVLVNQLENPFGRIAIEDVLAGDGSLKRLPIAQPEQGVVVPKDGRALRMELTSLDGVKKVTRDIKLQPGQRELIKW